MNLRLPPLGKTNYKLWKFSISAYADEHDLLDVLADPAPDLATNETEPARREKRSQAVRLITFTMTPEILIQLGDDILEAEPRDMMSRIAAYYEADASPVVHEVLRAGAEAMRIKPEKSVDEYFERHLLLRSKMQQARFPLIGSESTTVNFIIRGLAACPAYKQHITTLLLCPPTSIREAQVAVNVLEYSTSITQRPVRGQSAGGSLMNRSMWCDFHQYFGSHTTAQSRDLQRALTRQDQ